MLYAYGPSGLLPWAGPPTILLIALGLLQVLPGDVISFFTAWLLVALPTGVVIGHCALSED
jgi:hypothetical protein